MRTLLKLVAVLAFLSGLVYGQTTVTVTGQVLDPTGKIYQNGNGRAVLVPQNVNWLVNSTNPVPTPITISGLDSFGRFSISVTRTDLISPQTLTPKWQFSFCSQAIDFSPVCFTMTPITITTSQDITTQIQAQSALLPATGAGGNLSTQGTFTPGHMVTIFDATHLQDLNVTGAGIGALGVLNISPNFTGTVTMAGLKFPSQTGFTSCMYIDTTGLVNFTGTACGAGGGGGVAGLTKQFQFNNAGSLAGTGAQNNASQTLYDITTGKVSIPNLSGIRFADSYAWSQLPAADLTSAGSKTVTLAPCPLGIDVTANVNFPYKVYVSTTGTPEIVAVTGGSCAGGAASGTITFVTVNTHANGYTVSSASGGIQEAINDACGVGGTCQVQLSPAGSGTPNYTVRATVYVHGTVGGTANKIHLIGNGAYINCATRDVCVFNGTRGATSAYSVMQGIRFTTALNVDGVQITGISAAGGTYTVTAASHPFVTGDYASIDFYSPNSTQHTVKQVTVTDSSHFTFVLGSSTFSNTAPTWGWANIENAGIEDNTQGAVMRDIDFGATAGLPGFSYGIVIDNDQNANVEHLTLSSGLLKCTANFCGTWIYVRGDSGNAGILHLSDSDLTINCAGSGVLSQAGNSMSIRDTVIQGFAQYGVRYDGGLQGALISNLYEEVGNCSNPQYPGSLQAETGAQGTQITIQGTAPIVGDSPIFANTGANQRNYFVVPKSTTFGAGPVLFIGSATTNNAGTVNIYWPQVVNDNSGGTITYDILLTTGTTGPSPYSSVANSLATAQTGSCTNGLCTFADTHAATSAYTVLNQLWFPHLYFWPGSYVGTDTTNRDASIGVTQQFNLDKFTTTGLSGYASSYGIKIPSVTALICIPTQITLSPAWIICSNAPTSSSIAQATVLQQVGGTTAPVANSKGRLNLGTSSLAYPLDLITLLDSNVNKTFATANNRPLADANDMALSADQSGGASLRAQTSVSQYIASLADNTSWIERLTASAKNFKVAVTINDGSGGSKMNGPFGTCPTSGNVLNDLLCFDAIGDLSFNKKNATINRKVIPQDYLLSTLPVANTVDTGQLAVITDALTSACPVTTGGGSIRVLVRSNGTSWDCVSGPGSNAIFVGLFSGLPGSPANGQLAVITDWQGLCPITSGSGSALHEHFGIWNSGTSKWDCVPDGLLPYITTAQSWDGAGNGGVHFIPAGSTTNTTDQYNLHIDSTGSHLEYADGGGPPGLLYTLGMWPGTASIPSLGSTKCLNVTSTGLIGFESKQCFNNPITSTGDLIVGTGGGASARLAVGASGTAPVSNGTTLVNTAVLTNPMTQPNDLIIGGTAGAATRLANPGALVKFLQTTAGGAVVWDNAPAGSGTVNTGVACQPAYYVTSTAAVSPFAQICYGDGSTTAWMKINPTTAAQDIFNVSLNSSAKFWVDSAGIVHIGAGGVQANSNVVYNGNATNSNVDYSASTDSNSNQTGVATFRNGDVTGNTSSTAGATTVRGGNVSGTGATAGAGDVTIQPGALTNAAPGASATEGKTHVLNAYLKGGTTTTGNLGCIVSSSTVGDCVLANNGLNVGVITSTTGGTVYVQRVGRVTVNLDASSTFSANDRVCSSATGAAQGHTNGTAGCPSGSKEIGYATASGTTVTTVDVDLNFSSIAPSDAVTSASALANHGIVVGVGSQGEKTLAVAASGTVITGSAGADPVATATPVLGVNGSVNGSLGIANGGASGTTTTIDNPTATSAMTFHLPPNAATGVFNCTNSSGTMTCMQSGDSGRIFTATAQTAAVGTSTLCTTTNCPAGMYHVDLYMNETGTGCTTVGTGGATPVLTYADGVGTKTAQPMGGFGPAGSVLAQGKSSFTTTGTGDGMYSTVIRTDSSVTIQIATTFTACGTPGPWTGYNLKAVIYPVSGQ